MAGRCGCTSDSCRCFFESSDTITVSGSGSRDNPFVPALTSSLGAPVDPGAPPIGIPPGVIWEWGGTYENVPAGWLPCDGREVSRAVYAALFLAINTTRGAGNGTTTFNVPDRRDRIPIGASGTSPRGTKAGATTHTLTVGNLPAHAHGINHTHANTTPAGNHDHDLQRSDAVGSSGSTVPRGTGTITTTGGAAVLADGEHSHPIPAYTGTSASVGSGTAVNHMPPTEATVYMIKAT